mgnify:CR=1 FL=1
MQPKIGGNEEPWIFFQYGLINDFFEEPFKFTSHEMFRPKNNMSVPSVLVKIHMWTHIKMGEYNVDRATACLKNTHWHASGIAPCRALGCQAKHLVS